RVFQLFNLAILVGDVCYFAVYVTPVEDFHLFLDAYVESLMSLHLRCGVAAGRTAEKLRRPGGAGLRALCIRTSERGQQAALNRAAALATHAFRGESA